MRPDLIVEQIAHMLRADTILAGEGDYLDVLDGESVPNQEHLLIGKFRCGISLALRRAAFLFGVLHVVGVSAEKQMIRPHARRGVTAMQDQKSFRDRAVRQLPGNAVRKQCAAMARYPHVAITVPVGRSSPKPAGACLAYSTPESQSDRLRVSALPGAVAAKRAEPLVRSSAGPSKPELMSALLARANAIIQGHRNLKPFDVAPPDGHTSRGLSRVHSTSLGGFTYA